MRNLTLSIMLTLGVVIALPAKADVATAQKFADKYTAIAKNINPAFKAPDASVGQAFFTRKFLVKNQEVACASCHTTDPSAVGKHLVTDKPIRPLAPAKNEKRFVSLDKVEKNFDKHCEDIIGRLCTAEEKSNFITYLLTIK